MRWQLTVGWLQESPYPETSSAWWFRLQIPNSSSEDALWSSPSLPTAAGARKPFKLWACHIALCCSSTEKNKHIFLKFKEITLLFTLTSLRCSKLCSMHTYQEAVAFFLIPQSPCDQFRIIWAALTCAMCSSAPFLMPHSAPGAQHEAILQKTALSSFSSKLRASGNCDLPFISKSSSTAYCCSQFCPALS